MSYRNYHQPRFNLLSRAGSQWRVMLYQFADVVYKNSRLRFATKMSLADELLILNWFLTSLHTNLDWAVVVCKI